MSNIKNVLEKDDVSISYYLFRPDTLLKVIGEYTYIYNPVLKEWVETKPFSSYVQSNIEFRALKEEKVLELIEELSENIVIKKEISDEDIQDMVIGRKKIISQETENTSQSSHEDLMPEIFKDDDKLPDIYIKNNRFYENAFYVAILIIIFLILYIVFK